MAKPLKIQRGSVTVKIYRVRRRPCANGRHASAWEIRYKFGDKLYRHKRTLKTAAILLAEQRATAIANGRTAQLRLTDEQAYDYEHIARLAIRCGFASARQMADTYAALLEARGADTTAETTASEILAKFLTHKATLGLDEYTLRDYRVRLGRFAADFKLPFARVTGADVEQWLDALPVLNNKGQPVGRTIGARTRNNYLAALRDFANYARAHKLLPATWDELAVLKRVKTRGRKLIFTAAEGELLLAAASERSRAISRWSIIPALVLGAFAGLRTEEIQLLEWRGIDWDAGVIHVPDHITKTGESRLAPLLDNAREWLEPWRHAIGPVNLYANLSNQKARLAQKIGIKWKHNALRHSFGTYRVAVTRNRGQVSIEMGNSEREIKNSYERPRTHEEGLRWFEIRPQNTSSGLLHLVFPKAKFVPKPSPTEPSTYDSPHETARR